MAAVASHPRDSPDRVVGDYSSWTSFLDGGLKGVSEAVVLEGGRRVKLSWLDGHFSEYSLKWLRDHSDGSFNVNTKQREFDTFMMPNDTRMTHASVERMPSAASSDAEPNKDTIKPPPEQPVLRVRWDAEGDKSGHEECTVPIATLRQHCSSETARSLRQKFGTSAEVATPDTAPVLWGADLFSSATGGSPSRFKYEDIMASSKSSAPSAASQLMTRLKSHGVAIVRGVPTDLAGTEGLGKKFAGHLMGTLYGKESWSISTETVEDDTLYRNLAYTTDYLALHTDCVFLSEPPGIQVFNCQVQAAQGGASIYVDGFAVAERLRKEKPEAFEFFTKTSFTYRSFDDGYHYIAHGPLFRIGPLGVVDQLRYNDHHRTPLDYLSTDDIDRFYEYHSAFIAITRDPSMVARVILEPGDTVIFDNHRALHGRESYKGARRMVGCYIGMDEAKSEARMHGV